ncbi:MAG: insulinase family protein, partial [Opitutales bacterium]|nr:insulinase family protein [Opitutales bacterium]
MLETNPDAVATLRLEDWLYTQNHMFKFVEKDEMLKFDMKSLEAWLAPILKNSYMEVSVAGDFDEEKTLQWLKDYFGSLPPRQAKRADYSEFRKLEATPEEEKIFEVESSKDARSTAIKIWETCGRKDLKKMRAATILAAVLSDSIRKSVREKEGKVYSPFAYNLSKQGFDSGMIFAETEVAPEFNSEVASLIEKSAQSVANGITEDEFNRAKLPVVKQIEKTLRSNSYWADRVMPMFQADGLRRKTAETFADGYKEITLQDVQNAAAEFLKGKKAKTVKILPKKRD